MRPKRVRIDINHFLDSDPPDWFEVRFVSSDIGNGLFSLKDFERGDSLLFYRGKRLSAEQYEDLSDISYAFTNRRNLFIDAKDDDGCLARYINDSDESPNCYAKMYRDSSFLPHIMFVALTNITVGDELRYDYGLGGPIYRPWKSSSVGLSNPNLIQISGGVSCDEEKENENCSSSGEFSTNGKYGKQIKEIAGMLLRSCREDLLNNSSYKAGSVNEECHDTEEVQGLSTKSHQSTSKNAIGSACRTALNSTTVKKRETRQSERNEIAKKSIEIENLPEQTAESQVDSSTDEINADETSSDLVAVNSTRTQQSSEIPSAETRERVEIPHNSQEGPDINQKSATAPQTDTEGSASARKTIGVSRPDDTQNDIPIYRGDENDDNWQDLVFMPFQCFYCSTLLYGDFLIAKHVFLQECTKTYDIISPFFFKFLECKKCSTLIPGGEKEALCDHMRNQHNEEVSFRCPGTLSGNCAEYDIEMYQVERVIERAGKGQLKRKPKTFAKRNAVPSNVKIVKGNVQDADPDYCPSPVRNCKKKPVKKTTFLSDFDNLAASETGESSETLRSGQNANNTSGPIGKVHTAKSVASNNNVEETETVSNSGTQAAIQGRSIATGQPTTEETELSHFISTVCNVQSEKTACGKRTVLFPVVCQLCTKLIKIHTCLPRHLREVHKMTDETKLKVVAKVHYFQTRYGKTTRELFFCAKEDCLMLTTRKAIHNSKFDNALEHDLMKVRKVSDIPETVCPPGIMDQVAETVFTANKYNFDFNIAIENWAKEKATMYVNGKRKYSPEKMPSLIAKVKFLIHETRSFEYVACMPELFSKFENLMKVRQGSTKAGICRELRDFVRFCKLTLNPPVLEWLWVCDNMDGAIERFQQTAQAQIPAETKFNQEFKQQSIISAEQVKDCFYKIMKLLDECFEFLESRDLATKGVKEIARTYRLLQFALIFVVINRKVCRISTAMYLQKSHFERVRWNRKRQTVTFACFDQSLLEGFSCERVSGVRKFKHDILEQLRNTNKNFRKESVRRVVLTVVEFDYLLRYTILKDRMGLGEQQHLFLEMRQANEDLRKNVYSKWYIPLEKAIGMKIKLNSNVWRHSMCTIFSQYVTDHRTQKALDRHIGHSRRVAENFYELQPKEIDANVTSHVVDQLLQLPSAYNGEISSVRMGSSFCNMISVDDENECATEEVQEEDSDQNDDSDDEEICTREYESSHIVTKRKQSMPFMHEKSTGGIPSIFLISKFLTNRPRKRELTDKQNGVIAKYFYESLCDKPLPTKTDLFGLVEKSDPSSKTSYNHICYLLKDCKNWREKGFPMAEF